MSNLPEVTWYNSLQKLLSKSEVKAEVLDFSGIDLINDEVLHELSVVRDLLDKVTQVSFRGCHRITKDGIIPFAMALPSLSKVEYIFPKCQAYLKF